MTANTAASQKTEGDDTPEVAEAPKPAKAFDPTRERYWFCRIHEKQNKDDEDTVPIGWRGEVLVVPRGVETILPEKVLTDVLEHAAYPKYQVQPGKGNVETGKIQRFPVDKLRPATYEQFVALRKAGTQTTMLAVQAGTADFGSERQA